MGSTPYTELPSDEQSANDRILELLKNDSEKEAMETVETVNCRTTKTAAQETDAMAEQAR